MFVVPESDAKKPENRFEFQVGKVKHSVPKLGFVSGEAALLFEQGRGVEAYRACFDDPKALAAYVALDLKQQSALEAEWSIASKVTPGESEGSTDS